MTTRFSARLAALLVIFLFACSVHAGPPIGVTNYIPNTVFVPFNSTNASLTIMDTNLSYICFDMAQFSGMTPTNATGDVRVVVDTLLNRVNTSYDGFGTNIPVNFTIDGVPGAYTGSVIQLNYTIRLYKNVSGWSYPSE